jgi:fumarate reductase flavoprotein subunit
MTAIIVALACVSPVDSGVGGGEKGDSALETGGGLPDSAALAEVDVVIVGSGAGGLGAAWAAREAGSSVLVLERDERAGGASNSAGNHWAAGTPEQAAAGVADSPELALTEWAEFTGGDPADPSVVAFVNESAGVLSWLQSQGVRFTLSQNIPADTGTVPRIHMLTNGTPPGPVVLSELLADHILYETTATGVVLDGERVAGVWVTNAQGEEAWIHARSTVLATGGFTRNDALVEAAVPELTAQETWYEAWPTNDGNGLAIGAGAGAATQNTDHVGLYVHAVADAKLGAPEVMVVTALETAVVVDRNGRRVADERQFGSVSMGYRWLEEGPFFAIYDEELWAQTRLQGRGFNYEGEADSLELTGAEYAERRTVAEGADAAALAEALGLDAAGLTATLERYNLDAEAGVDSEHGKPAAHLLALDSPPFRGLPLVLGRAKSFGGLATDATGAVTDDAGVPIPGLFGAGEVTGFLGTPGVGYGHNGTITAAWWSGLRAGKSAAGN